MGNLLPVNTIAENIFCLIVGGQILILAEVQGVKIIKK